MKNPISSLFRWLFNKNEKQSKVYRNINEELIEKEKQYKQLAKENASLKGQLSKLSAEKIEKKEKVKKEDVQNEIAKSVSEESVNLKKNEYGDFFSFKEFYRKYLNNKKFKEKFEIADKDDKVSWKFGDFGIFPNIKSLAVIDREGNIRCVSQFLGGIIHKPETIFNQVKRNRILIASDENGEYINGIDNETDLDDYELPVPVYNEETKEWEEKSGYKKKARDIIIDFQNNDKNLRDRIKRIEMSSNILRRENEEIKRSYDVLLHAGKVGQSTITEAMGFLTSLSMESSDINKKIASLTENNVHLEQTANVWKNVAKDLLQEVETNGSQNSMQRAIALMNKAREFERANPPQEREEPPKIQISQPGELVGKGGKLQ